jgi:light-regulated signal transduction histidine kinase (bacteriophytochrome)
VTIFYIILKNIENNEEKMNLQIRSVDSIKLILIDNEVIVDKINLNHQIVFQPVAFNQIIQNLISNAIKYNDKEVTKITISYSEEEKAITIKITPRYTSWTRRKVLICFILQASPEEIQVQE